MNFLVLTFAMLMALVQSSFAVRLAPVDPKLAPDIFIWTDTCNAYVMRHADVALLIDLGK